MQCTKCNSQNDTDARYCSECGADLASAKKTRKAYLYVLFLLPVLIAAAAIGYYKFILPKGVAAYVNGEVISLSDLDRAVSLVSGTGQADGGLRYRVLNTLITERLVLQEARRAGIEASAQDIESALAEVRARSGLTESAFNAKVTAEYGSMSAFEENMQRDVTINKFIATRIVPPDADQRSKELALNRWLQKVSSRANVRVTLAEELPGECGCGMKPSAAAGSDGCRMAGAGCAAAGRKSPASGDADKAKDAALRYWHEHHGPGAVTTRVTDFGCHVQVDIMKDDRNVGSLRYQAGTISEF